ncbi:MAG: zinc ribbon domain-containing protein [Promethearchaeota archaeon]
MNLTKHETIKATLRGTKARRKHQSCKVFTVKIDCSHLNLHTKYQLKMLFLEAKWLYNRILAHENVFDMDYKLSEVTVKVKDCFERHTLTHLSSHMKQSLITRTIDNIKGLARLVDRFFPCTKTCSRCGNIQEIGLDERIYVCPLCGLMDRDHNSSVNLENEGVKQVPMGSRDVKPVETDSSTVASLEFLNGISYVTARSVVEAGSLTALAWGSSLDYIKRSKLAKTTAESFT